MRKRTLVMGFVFVVAMAYCMNAYAAEGASAAWHGFLDSVGGFLYNALPWNWGNWAGK